MKIIVCLDEHDGMLFNRRRQRKDSALRRHVLQMCAEGVLWMNRYSAAQFSEEDMGKDIIIVAENFLDKAGPNDYCFLENNDISAYADQVKQVIVYRWNRDYPRDMTFPTELFCRRWQQVSREEFPGTSHEKITREVYER